MCHVIDKVVFYFSESFLAKYGVNRKCKYDYHNKRKDYGRYHKADTGEDVLLHVREMNIKNSHLRSGVIRIKFLPVGLFFSYVFIIRATEHFTAVRSGYP